MKTAALLLIAIMSPVAAAEETARISAAEVNDSGFYVHRVESPYQDGATKIKLLLPETLTPGHCYPVIYVLPVEAGDEHRYGDGLLEVKRHDPHNRRQAIFVAPTFSQLPWYADHPSDAGIRQESHLLKVVLPAVERSYPVLAEPRGRLLLGFSKSGWGAWSLLLRHGDIFGRAAAWDAPLQMDAVGNFGSGPIFGTPENFERYQITRLLAHRGGRARPAAAIDLAGTR